MVESVKDFGVKGSRPIRHAPVLGDESAITSLVNANDDRGTGTYIGSRGKQEVSASNLGGGKKGKLISNGEQRTGTPYPLLKVSQGNDLNGNPIYKSVLLVNFGKKGVKEIVDQLQNKIGNLEEYEITLRGTLIYYDGKTSLEFTDGPDSIIKYEKSNVKTLPRQTTALGTQKFTGEIVDPKCYLGVMKPAWGKAHRSCARRCISGGIPPVLIVTNEQGESNYLLITDKTGSPLHGEILPFVGLNVEMEGEVEQVDDWLVLKVNLNDIVLSTTVNGWFENLLTELKIIEENEICHIHPTSFISLCY